MYRPNLAITISPHPSPGAVIPNGCAPFRNRYRKALWTIALETRDSVVKSCGTCLTARPASPYLKKYFKDNFIRHPKGVLFISRGCKHAQGRDTAVGNSLPSAETARSPPLPSIDRVASAEA